MNGNGLGLMDLDHVEIAVNSIDTYRPYFEDRLSFVPLAASTPEAAARAGQRSVVYGVGKDRIIVTEPITPESRVGRFLRVHPAGVMTIGATVEDLAACHRELVRREATVVSDVLDGVLGRTLAIASPLGDVEFSFAERRPGRELDGFNRLKIDESRPRFPWVGIDHITANTRTAWPIAEWYRRVLGMEDLFFGELHTAERPSGPGSGFKWMIVWDPVSSIKLATNEPLQPNFYLSQTEQFVLDNRGPGIQHLALAVPRITDAVARLGEAGVKFLSTPASYYNPERLRARARAAGWNFDAVTEPIERLRDLGILIDGSPAGHLLQIFQEDLAHAIGQRDGSPLFFEVIQREGDKGFGHGTFRALFEAIENSQGLVRGREAP